MGVGEGIGQSTRVNEEVDHDRFTDAMSKTAEPMQTRIRTKTRHAFSDTIQSMNQR